MKTFYLRGLNLLLFSSIVSNCYAQASNLQFEHITIRQGLSHNFVMKVMQDRKGYLWFGTGSGLDKYDGYRFTNYKFDPFDSTSLPKNQVFSLYEDRDGMIWVGTSEGTSKFDPRTEKFTRLERSTTNPYAFKYAQSFSEDSEGNLWVAGSFEGELRQVDRKTGTFSSYNYAAMLGGIPDSLKGSQSLYITYKDSRGTLWVGNPAGLHRLNLTSQGKGKASKVTFTHYRHDRNDSNTISNNAVSGIYEDRSGMLWIATMNGELNAFDQKSGKFTRYILKPPFFGLLQSGITEDFDGNIWVGTTVGLYKLDKEQKIVNSFFHDPTDPGSISNNFIISVLTDKSGTVWVATPEGIDKIDPHKKPFALYRNDAYNPHSLSQNKVAAILEDKRGIVRVGTMGGGLNALDKETGRFSYYRHNPNDPSSLNSDTASAILEDKSGRLWVGNGHSLSLLARDMKKFTHYPLKHPFLSTEAASPIFTIYEDREGIFWLGTNNGIINFNPKTGKTINYPYDPSHPERISDWWALSILEDKKGIYGLGRAARHSLNSTERPVRLYTINTIGINREALAPIPFPVFTRILKETYGLEQAKEAYAGLTTLQKHLRHILKNKALPVTQYFLF